MAVTEIVEIQNPSADYDATAGRDYTRVFRVDVSDPTADGPAVVWLALTSDDTYRIYGFGVQYKFGDAVSSKEFDSAYLNRASIRPMTTDGDDFHSYIVTLEYGPPIGPDPLALKNDDRGFDPIEVDVDYVQFESPVERDIYRRQVQNSARDPYNPGITRDDSRYIVTVTRNEANIDFDLFNLIKDSVNKTRFLGRAPRCVKAKPPKARRLWNPDTGYYFQVVYQFEINDTEYRVDIDDNLPNDPADDPSGDPDSNPADGPIIGEDPEPTKLIGQGWDRVILDAGFRYLDVSSTPATRKQILVDGQPVQDPVPLDGRGATLATNKKPKYRVYRVYKEFEFNDLNFGLG